VTGRQEGWITVWHFHARPHAAAAAPSRVPGGAVKVLRYVLLALVACSGLVLAAVPGVALAQGTAPSSCPKPAAGQVSCAATLAPGSTAIRASGLAAATPPPGYGPLALRYAYGLEYS
jgi:hypothetical protein